MDQLGTAPLALSSIHRRSRNALAHSNNASSALRDITNVPYRLRAKVRIAIFQSLCCIRLLWPPAATTRPSFTDMFDCVPKYRRNRVRRRASNAKGSVLHYKDAFCKGNNL